MALKVRVAGLAVTVCLVDFSCGDAMFVNFFCGVACGVQNFPCPPLTAVQNKSLNFYVKAGVHVKAVLTSLNTAFLPI